MSDQNVAPIYGSIHSYSSQQTGYEATKIIDDSVSATEYRSSTNASEWIIIDLGAERPISGFKIWSGISSNTGASIKNYRVGVSNTPSSFSIVASGQVAEPTLSAGKAVMTYHETAVSETTRYIKIYLDDNWLFFAFDYIASGEFEIYSSDVQEDQDDILSNAEVYEPVGGKDILSDLYVIPQHTYTEKSTIASDATIGDEGSNIPSDTLIVASNINSDAVILATETATIVSDLSVYRSGSAGILPVFMTGRSTGRITDTLIEASGSRSLLVYTTDISTSDEVVVADMLTSSVMDMLIITPPLGYQNYDWKYDWVVRTYDLAQYKFEIRTGDTLPELNTAVFSRINQDQIILRGQVPRYHQWRCHVWASGSSDFELHQFTIKGYIDWPANPLYRSLQDQPFTTVSTIKKGVQRLYEPLDPKLWGGTYVPGDCDADEIVDAYDLAYLTSYLLYGGSVPSPLLSGDVNYDIVVDAVDLTYLTDYLRNNGPPPIWLGNI